MIKVLIVDDHEIARAGIKHTLLSIPKIKVVGEASHGLEALQLAKELNPHIVLMDIHMPGLDGFETTKKMLLTNPSIRVIALSATEEAPYPARMLEAGARGYVTKDCATSEIVKAVHTILAGKQYVIPSIAQRLALKQPANVENSIFDTLSLRELQIALSIIEGKDIHQIASIFFLSSKTVLFYRHQLFKKLNIANAVELVLLAKKAKLLSSYVTTKQPHV